MTEPNDVDGAGQGRVEWPAAAALTGDPAVDAVLARLDSIPSAAVQEHGTLYEGIHEDLVAALDREPSEAVAAASQKPGSSDGGGA